MKKLVQLNIPISCMNNFHLTRQSCTYVHFPKWKRRTFKLYFLMQILWVNLKYLWLISINFTKKIISAINLMEKMLEIDADKRINAAQTLSHPYLEEVKMKMLRSVYHCFQHLVCWSFWWTHCSILWPNIWRLWSDSGCLERKSLEHNQNVQRGNVWWTLCQLVPKLCYLSSRLLIFIFYS